MLPLVLWVSIESNMTRTFHMNLSRQVCSFVCVVSFGYEYSNECMWVSVDERVFVLLSLLLGRNALMRTKLKHQSQPELPNLPEQPQPLVAGIVGVVTHSSHLRYNPPVQLAFRKCCRNYREFLHIRKKKKNYKNNSEQRTNANDPDHKKWVMNSSDNDERRKTTATVMISSFHNK